LLRTYEERALGANWQSTRYDGDECPSEEERAMPATNATTEISAISDTSFEDAIQQGIARAISTLRGVEGAWIKDMNVMIENGSITGYKVNMEVTFVLEDSESRDEPEETALRPPARERPRRLAPDNLIDLSGLPQRHVLLEDLTEEDLERSNRFLTITPAKRGSGFKDVSVNHDQYLFGD
jgi:flavin-binding protein dodecin